MFSEGGSMAASWREPAILPMRHRRGHRQLCGLEHPALHPGRRMQRGALRGGSVAVLDARR
jgi:hypothetical protein